MKYKIGDRVRYIRERRLLFRILWFEFVICVLAKGRICLGYDEYYNGCFVESEGWYSEDDILGYDNLWIVREAFRKVISWFRF